LKLRLCLDRDWKDDGEGIKLLVARYGDYGAYGDIPVQVMMLIMGLKMNDCR